MMQSGDFSLHHSDTDCLLDTALDVAGTLGRYIWALDQYTPNGEGFPKDVKHLLLEEQGVYRMPAHILKCLWYPPSKQCENIL
jgi:hypothetical protein